MAALGLLRLPGDRPRGRARAGGVDITGPARRAHPFAFALTLSIANSIEQLLMVLSLQRRQVLLDTFRQLEQRWPSDPILVVSKSGQLVGLNGPANRIFGLAGSDDSPGLLSEVAPEIWSPLRQAIERGAAIEEVLSFRSESVGEHSVTCRIDPISRDGQTIGSTIVFTEGPGPEAGRAVDARLPPLPAGLRATASGTSSATLPPSGRL